MMANSPRQIQADIRMRHELLRNEVSKKLNTITIPVNDGDIKLINLYMADMHLLIQYCLIIQSSYFHQINYEWNACWYFCRESGQ